MMYIEVAFGFVLLLGAAEFLVRGAVVLAKKLGISPLVIGMTVVAVGTSAPELVVSLDAALEGVPGIAIGNVIGSNIANILLILGVACLVAPIPKRPDAHLHDGSILLAGSFLFALLAWQGEIGVIPGLVLLVFFFGFLGHSYWRGTRHGDQETSDQIAEVEQMAGVTTSLWKASLLLFGGLAGVTLGADILVEGGTAIARTFEVSEEVIGLTLIALGTSLPELAASVVAAYRGHADVALGNVVGSNLFNVVGIVGVVALVVPLPVGEQILAFDLWVMLGVTIILIPFLIKGWRFGRLPASVFLLAYIGYIALQGYGVGNIISLSG